MQSDKQREAAVMSRGRESEHRDHEPEEAIRDREHAERWTLYRLVRQKWSWYRDMSTLPGKAIAMAKVARYARHLAQELVRQCERRSLVAPFDEGEQAARDGHHVQSCPYPSYDPVSGWRREWMAGYELGVARREGESESSNQQ
jgi:hypothetical protein